MTTFIFYFILKFTCFSWLIWVLSYVDEPMSSVNGFVVRILFV